MAPPTVEVVEQRIEAAVQEAVKDVLHKVTQTVEEKLQDADNRMVQMVRDTTEALAKSSITAGVTVKEEAVHKTKSPKLPMFWHATPEQWFLVVEATFQSLALPTQEWFNNTLRHLDAEAVKEVMAAASATPSEEAYKYLKDALLWAFGKSEEQKASELLSLRGLGGRKPSSMLRYMESLIPVSEQKTSLFKVSFLQTLPEELHAILAATGKDKSVKMLADEADRWMEARGTASVPTLSTISNQKQTRSSSFVDDKGLCRIHARYGEAAFKCLATKLCKMANKIKPAPLGNEQAGR